MYTIPHILFLFAVVRVALNALVYPEECTVYHVVNNDNGVSMECHMADISFNKNNFTAIPSPNTLEIIFICNNQIISSATQNGMLSHLKELQNLFIYNCSLPNLAEGMLQGLQSLVYLHLQYEPSYDHFNPKYSLQIPEGFFNYTPLMKFIILPNNNISYLHPRLFCPLNQLVILNLTNNHLTTIDRLLFDDCNSNLLELYLNNNHISNISHNSFSSLKSLKILQLTNNRIVNFTGSEFTNLVSLLQLYLSWNSISYLPHDLLQNNSLLLDVKLDRNNLKYLPKDFFSNNRQLLFLDLSNNKLHLTCAEMSEFLYDVRNLQSLNLEKNDLNCFDMADTMQKTREENSTNPLLSLSLAVNSLQSINASTFEGLENLGILNLSFCDIEKIDLETFIHTPQLELVLLNNNKLTEIPNFGNNLELKYLDLSNNYISKIIPQTFKHKQLLELSIADNKIETIPSKAFSLPSLTSLYLDHNRINDIEANTFENCPSLINLHLHFNQLKSLNGTFGNISALENLTVGNNLFESFGYDHFPLSLKFLDISYNRLKYFWAPYDNPQISLQELKAVHNLLTYLKPAFFSRSLRKIFLQNNKISVIDYNTFVDLPDLTFVDLSFNRLTDSIFGRLSPLLRRSFPKNRFPIFSVLHMEKMYNCTCSLSQLLRYSNTTIMLESPAIDIRNLFCTRSDPWTKEDNIFFLQDLHRQSDLWCSYTIHNRFGQCPQRCTCFYNSKFAVLIQCSNTHQHEFPRNLPIDLSKINLDYNEITNLTDWQKNITFVQVISLKQNQIQSLEGQPFSGLIRLRELHLNHNLITELQGSEFMNLSTLQYLYLDNNNISYIHPETFSSLINLLNLTLNNNNLHRLQCENTLRFDKEFLIFPEKSELQYLTLNENPWSCKCDFVQFFRKWLLLYGNQVKDINHTYCYPEDESLHEGNPVPIIDFNEALYCTVVETIDFLDLTIPLSLTIAIISTICITCLLVFKFQKELQVWLYSRYGIRLFHYKNEADEGKLFDAFISYSSYDEDFVARILVPGLEVRHQPPYRLCIHERDFIVGGYIQNSIVEAVEKSSRTLLVLSKNFVRSEWCRLEFKSAHHQALQDKCCRLIIVVLEDVPEEDLDIELKLYLNTNTYLKWGDRFFWDKLYFALPDIKVNLEPNQMIRRPTVNNTTAI